MFRKDPGSSLDFTYHGSVSYQGHVAAFQENSLFFRVECAVTALSASGITDGSGTACIVHGRFKHLTEFCKTRGTVDLHAGNRPQICNVEDSVVGLSVAPDQSGPVHCKDHMQLLQGHVMDQHVETALQEAGIDRKDRKQPLLGHAGRHGRGITFGDPHIRKARRESSGKAVQPGAIGHGRRYCHQCRILFRQRADRLSEAVRKTAAGR